MDEDTLESDLVTAIGGDFFYAKVTSRREGELMDADPFYKSISYASYNIHNFGLAFVIKHAVILVLRLRAEDEI